MTAVKSPSDVRNVKRERLLFDGGLTAEELHIKMLAQPCHGCGKPACLTLETFVPLLGITPSEAAHAAVHSDKPGQLPIHRTRAGEQWVPVKRTFVCKVCGPEAERAVARLGSRYHVMIDRGPGPDKTTVAINGR